MKELPNVTLIAYDNSAQPDRTIKVLHECASLIQFGAVVFVLREMPSSCVVNGTVHFAPEIGYAAAMQFEVTEIHKYVPTDFALFVSHDGTILNEDAWRDEWLCFDYIGAPWPKWLCDRFPDFRVGNSGFCLKSRAFMRNCAELGGAFNPNTPGDVFTSQTIRPQLESRGMKYAPLEVAADFSWELNIEEFPNGRPDAFGHHTPK